MESISDVVWIRQAFLNSLMDPSCFFTSGKSELSSLSE